MLEAVEAACEVGDVSCRVLDSKKSGLGMVMCISYSMFILPAPSHSLVGGGCRSKGQRWSYQLLGGEHTTYVETCGTCGLQII